VYKDLDKHVKNSIMAQRPRGPEAQRPRGPEAQRPRGPEASFYFSFKTFLLSFFQFSLF
jgi:hypothetical protein